MEEDRSSSEYSGCLLPQPEKGPDDGYAMLHDIDSSPWRA